MNICDSCIQKKDLCPKCKWNPIYKNLNDNVGKEVNVTMKTNNLESKVIILQTAIEVFKNGMEHIDQAINRIPNPVKVNDLNAVCTEINRIKEIVSLVHDTLGGIATCEE